MMLLLCEIALATTTGGLPRFPDIGNGRVVFTAGGDLWSVDQAGGTARRLTTHPGQERFARISPDGKWIAYTAEYEGESDVWVVPFEGGQPRRLTWHSGGWMDDVTWDWTADSDRVVFSSRFESVSHRYRQLYSVGLDGGLPRAYPLSDVGPTALAPNGDIVFNRHFRNFRTWKRYTGGSQQDLWRWNGQKSEKLTSFPGTDTQPMVHADGTIYFVSDRPETDGHFSRRNLFRYTAEGTSEQLTSHERFDVAWPSLDGDRIVYMLGGELRIFDIAGKTDGALNIDIPDEALQTRPTKVQVHDKIRSLTVGPQGKRVGVVAGGDLFTVPARLGEWREVTSGSEGRIYSAAWSPNGDQIAYVSDASGEQQLWVVNQSGTQPPRQLTKDNDTWLDEPQWSKTGTDLLITDKRMRLWKVDAGSGVRTLIDTGEADEIFDETFSPDGKWIAYVKPDANNYGSIWLYEVSTGKKTRVTSDFNHDTSPTFSDDGTRLYFVSKRNFDLIGNVFEHRFVHRMTDLIYVVRLKADGADPLEPRSDEEVDEEGEFVIEADAEETKKERRKRKRREKKAVLPSPPTSIDVEGIADRVQRLPLPPGRYFQLQANAEGLFYLSGPAVPGEGGGDTWLYYWHEEEQENRYVLDGVVGYALAAGGDKLLYLSHSRGLFVTDAQQDASPGDRIDTYGLASWVDPKVEWKRTLDEVRRYMRDYFYDPGMHGHDWDAIHETYAALLDRATVPDDVIWLLGEMVGELNVGHAYVAGPWDNLPRKPSAFLGAQLTPEGEGVRISKIYAGEPGNPDRQSPLRAPGVDVREGDWLVAIDGRPVDSGANNPFRWLVGTIDRPVRIEVNRTSPSRQGAQEYVVYPIDWEGELRYWDWVEANRAKVLAATDNRVGYVHLPDTAVSGYTEFVRGLYAQHHLDGLVIDVRFNGGGFIPEMFIEHLLRPHFNTWVPRDGKDWETPSVAVHGPKVCLTNGYAGSGGDAFPYYFRQFGLGKLVGQTTWGGLVGIDNSLDLLIGGGVYAPSFGFVNTDGEWDVERVGVAPDIAVVDPPEALRQGQDPQLDAALQQILDELKEWKDPVPKRPARFPVRK